MKIYLTLENNIFAVSFRLFSLSARFFCECITKYMNTILSFHFLLRFPPFVFESYKLYVLVCCFFFFPLIIRCSPMFSFITYQFSGLINILLSTIITVREIITKK